MMDYLCETFCTCKLHSKKINGFSGGDKGMKQLRYKHINTAVINETNKKEFERAQRF